MAASTGVAPASSGLKDPDPELLDDEAERLRGIAPITQDRDQLRSRCAARPWRAALRIVRSAARCRGPSHSSPLAGLGAGAIYALRAPSQKEHTPSPLSRRGVMRLDTVWTPAGFGCGRWLIDLGSAVKPRMESGIENERHGSAPRSGSLCMDTKNPLPGGKWVRENQVILDVQDTPLPCLGRSG